jgi:hypothetical protein
VSDWEFEWTPPEDGSGRYGMLVVAVDAAGNVVKKWMAFSAEPAPDPG